MTSPKSSHVVKRPPQPARILRRQIATTIAAEAIGPIEKGCEIFGVNKGSFSIIDIIEHAVNATGPCDVTISTWTAAGADIDHALRMLADERIRSLRFVVDFSFPTRQPAYCAALRERFGDEALRLTKVHAKFVTIRNDAWNLVIRSSMNLNENRRLETFEISDHAGMADFLGELVDELFTEHTGTEQFEQTPYQRVVDFEKWREGDASPELVAERAAQAHQSFFGDGVHARDLRRSGLSTRRGKLA